MTAKTSLNPDERPIQTAYPSIASLRIGRWLGLLYNCLPLKIGTIRVSHLIFPLPTAPLAAGLYLGLKAVGRTYQLTTHRLHVARGQLGTPLGEISLDEVGTIDVVVQPGYEFFHAGDLVVRDHQGLERLRLEGIAHPQAFRQTILDTRNAFASVEAAQRTIATRQLAKSAPT